MSTPAHGAPVAQRLLAPWAWIDAASPTTDERSSEAAPSLRREVAFDLDASGRILEIHLDGAGRDPSGLDFPVRELGRVLVMPGLVNAHSHAFQRAIRGKTHRRGEADPNSFWSWRDAMYAVALRLDPDEVYTLTRDCFAEMRASGITCVGEFHYLHHDPEGRPYAQPHRLSEAVISAARELGLRLTLLEVFYARAGAGLPPRPEQRRFCDASLEHFLARVEALREGEDPQLRIGIAPHSVRAVGRPALEQLARWRAGTDIPVHMHISEQVRENEECQAEHGLTPLGLVEACGLLDDPGRFTAVHAIHLEDADFERLRGQQVCACPSTEADLGDGIVLADRLHAGGVGLALGSDSNARIDLVLEGSALEMNLRLLRQARLCLGDAAQPSSTVVAGAATLGGGRALGWTHAGRLRVGAPFDAALFDLDDPLLRGLEGQEAFDALWMAGSSRACSQSWIDGVRRV